MFHHRADRVLRHARSYKHSKERTGQFRPNELAGSSGSFDIPCCLLSGNSHFYISICWFELSLLRREARWRTHIKAKCILNFRHTKSHALHQTVRAQPAALHLIMQCIARHSNQMHRARHRTSQHTRQHKRHHIAHHEESERVIYMATILEGDEKLLDVPSTRKAW